MPVETVDYHFDPQELTLSLTQRYFVAAQQLLYSRIVVLDLQPSIAASPSASLILSPPCRVRSGLAYRSALGLSSHAEESAEPQAQEEEAPQ